MRLASLLLSVALPALAAAPLATAQTAPAPVPASPGAPSAAAPPLAAAAKSPAITADPNAPRGRLGDAVKPVAYRLDLTVDPAKPRFSGQVEIDVDVRQAGARSIYMHGRGLAVQSIVARVGRAGAEEGRGATYIYGTWIAVDPTGVAHVEFNQPLPAGRLSLLINYDAPFGEGPAAFYRVRVGGKWYAWTQHESIDARATFPGFDEPGFKVPFTVTLRTPRGLKAVSNAPETGVTRDGASDIHRFAPTLPLPTYLVAMMVGPFAIQQADAPPSAERPEPLPLRIVATQPNAGRMGYAAAQSGKIVSLLEDYFGERFPFPKLDQIGSPIEGGAMENAGADNYDDTILLLDANPSTAAKRRFGMVVAHELAHQWFGDIVTPAWWDDIWLNESFANWMGYRIGDAWDPSLNIRAGAIAEAFTAMDTDALLAGRPIHQAIATNDPDRRRVRHDHLWQGRAGGGDDRRLHGRRQVPGGRAPVPCRAQVRQRDQHRLLRRDGRGGGRSQDRAGDAELHRPAGRAAADLRGAGTSGQRGCDDGDAEPLRRVRRDRAGAALGRADVHPPRG